MYMLIKDNRVTRKQNRKLMQRLEQEMEKGRNMMLELLALRS